MQFYTTDLNIQNKILTSFHQTRLSLIVNENTKSDTDEINQYFFNSFGLFFSLKETIFIHLIINENSKAILNGM